MSDWAGVLEVWTWTVLDVLQFTVQTANTQKGRRMYQLPTYIYPVGLHISRPIFFKFVGLEMRILLHSEL